MTATPTPLRELPAKWRSEACDIRHTTNEPGPHDGARAEELEACADELEAALSARDEAGAVPYAELPAKMAYDIDPDTGADRGSCCGHAYADGWNDCIEAVRRVPAAPPPEARPAAQATCKESLQVEPADRAPGEVDAFREWWRANVPGGTVISNPDWWADRIIRRLAAVAPAGMDGVFTADEVAEAMEVLRGRHGSTALLGEVLDDMERVLLAAATPPATAGAVYRCDYCGSDYTQAKYCCQARRDYLNAHGQYETATPSASGEAEELTALLERLSSHPLVVAANYGDATGSAICTRAAALIRRLAAVAPAGMDGWIPVSERLPTDDDYGTSEDVLVRYHYADSDTWDVGEAYHYGDDRDYRDNGGWGFGSARGVVVSHWMPKSRLLAAAPTPPATAGQE